MIRYAVRYYEEDEWHMAEIPALDIVTQGESPEDIRHMAQDAVSAVLQTMVWSLGKEIPKSDEALPKGLEWVYPYQQTAIAIEVRNLRKEAGLSQLEAAARIGVSGGTYQRWEDPQKCNARVDTLEKIAAAFGRRYVGLFVA